ncbi:MAG TPA: lipopolysaccharide biosynthesis protein [Gemmatimonadales bacterium]|nr:lipopolysaccharide biosynthesis protein [Gemmatimonadales bacterium]
MKRSLTQQTVAGMAWMIYGKVAFAILQLVILGLLARLLSPADFGIIAAAEVVIGFSAIVSQLGLGPALVQRPALEDRHVATAFTASVVLGVVLGAIIWFGASVAAQFLHMPAMVPVLHVLAWVFPLQGMQTVASSLMSRELRFRWLANLDVITYAIGYGLIGVTAALLHWGVWALVAAQMAQTLLKTIVLLSQHPPRLRHFADRSAFGDLMYFGGGFTMARIANYVALNGDDMTVGRFLGPSALGYYGRAYALMSAPAYGFGTVLDAVLFPAMAKVQDDVRRLAAAYRRGVALIALLVLMPSMVIVLLAPELIEVVLGPKWMPVVAPFRILGIGMLFRTSYKMSDSITRSTGAVYRRAWRQFAYAGLVLFGAWIGQHWGIAGVAWGTLAALTVNFVLMAELGLDVGHVTWSEFWQAHRPALLLTAATFPPIFAATAALRHFAPPPVVTVIAVAVLALAVGLALMLAAPGTFLGADGQWMLETLRTFIRRLRPEPAASPAVAMTAE